MLRFSSPANGAVNQPISLNRSWGTVTGAASYSILVSASSSFAATVSSQTGLAGLTASVSGLSDSTPDDWEVNATNVGGTSPWSSVWSFTTIVALPAAPVIVSPTNAFTNGQSLTLSWGAVATATSYAVQVAIVSTFSSTTISQSGLTMTSYAFTPNTGVKNYCRVSATNVAGSGTWSGVWTLTPAVSVLHSSFKASAYTLTMKEGVICFSLPKAEQVELSLCDILGRTVMTISKRQAAAPIPSI